jgi:hypothetical protein
MERNGQMGALVADLDPERVVLIGTPTRSARMAIPQKWHDTIVDLGGTRDASELVDEIVRGIDGEASLVAVGNIHGQGELLLEQLGTLPAATDDSVREPRDRRLNREQAGPTPYRRPRNVTGVPAGSRPPQASASAPQPRVRHRRES